MPSIRASLKIWALAVGLAPAAALAQTPPPATAAAAAPHPLPQPQVVAPGVWLIPGSFEAKRQPDGNTIIFSAPKGLVVMDTGRHLWQRQAILEFAKSRHAPIVAIINSHWHLDHVSGNPDLKRAYPHAKVYASRAIEAALTGFLPKSASEAKPYLNSDKLPPETKEDLRNDFATIENGQVLRPDVPVEASKTVNLGGRRMELNLAPNAATDGDVWVYDPATRIAAVGDLVTLPAPFLDTACSKGWQAGLDAVWAKPFVTVIPGHGAPMTRARFAAYRAAFSALVDCSAGKRDKAECARDWVAATADLRDPGERATKGAQGMTEYYVQDVLRAHGGNSEYCKG